MTKKLCFLLLLSCATIPTVLVGMVEVEAPGAEYFDPAFAAEADRFFRRPVDGRVQGPEMEPEPIFVQGVQGAPLVKPRSRFGNFMRAIGGGIKVASAGLWSGTKKAASCAAVGTAIGWRLFWGQAPQAVFIECQNAGILARCPADADNNTRQSYEAREKLVQWGRELIEHGNVKGRAIRFVALRSLLHAGLGAAAGAITGGVTMRSCQDAAGMAVLVGGVSGVISALCQSARVRFDRIAEHRNHLIKQALERQIDPVAIVAMHPYITANNSWMYRRDVDSITEKVFEYNHGRTLLAANID